MQILIHQRRSKPDDLGHAFLGQQDHSDAFANVFAGITLPQLYLQRTYMMGEGARNCLIGPFVLNEIM